MRYTPKPVPASGSLNGFLREELVRIGNGSDQASQVTLTELGAAPDKLEDGQLIYANGTDYDPGNGEGLYGRIAGAWTYLSGGLDPAANETITGDWTFNGTVSGTGMDAYAALADNETITGSWTFDAPLTMADGRDIFVDTNNGITALVSSGTVNLDLNTESDGGSNTCTVRVHRTTNTTEFADTTFYRGNNTSTAVCRIRYDHAGAEGKVQMLQGTKTEWFNAGNTESTTAYHDGTNLLLEPDDGDNIVWIKSNTDTVLTLEGDANNVTETDNVWIQFYQDGQTVGLQMGLTGSANTKPDGNTFTGVAANDFVISGDGDGVDVGIGGSNGVALRVINSDDVNHGIRIYDNDHTTYASLYHSNAGSFTLDVDNDTPLVLQQQGQGYFFHDVQLCVDDDTITFTLPTDGGMGWLVASTTSIAESGQPALNFYISGTTSFNINSPANWQLGSGSNPDVDSDHNVWRSANSVLSVKNRRGSSRYYCLYFFGGNG